MSKTQGLTLKRVFDVAAAGAGLIVAAPVIVLEAGIMALATGNSPIFSQTRVGQNGETFKIYKVRTMRDAFNPDGLLLPAEERTPAVGKFLRKSRLDELPQLWNVLKGDMSIVGPRPVTAQESIAHDPLRQSVKPGITGLAQINNPNELSQENVLLLDQWYVETQSMAQDLEIILATPMALLTNWSGSHHRSGLNLTRHV